MAAAWASPVRAEEPSAALWGPDAFTVDEQDRRFRVRFDPGSRIHVGLGTGVTTGDGLRMVTDLELGGAYRGWLESDEPVVLVVPGCGATQPRIPGLRVP